MPGRLETNKVTVHAELYIALAEALAEPPAWLAEAGREWPLFVAAVHLAHNRDSKAARQAVEGLAAIRPESLDARRRRYRGIFAGLGCPSLWQYESLYVDGRLLGPSTFAVQQVYSAAGLKPEGAELPDHASIELAFLGWLAEQEAKQPASAADWQQLTHRFIERHAGRWLPDMGRALDASGDPVYAPIGQLLAGWLTEVMHSPSRQAKIALRLPAIAQAEGCTLCGFCVQVCPTRALVVCETDVETELRLIPAACVSCGKCEQVCDSGVLHLEHSSDNDFPVTLRHSPRAACPNCGQPTVSHAELKAIAARLGQWPCWLDYCLECRPTIISKLT